MAKLFLVQLVHGRVELSQNFQAGRRDARFDDAAVFGLAFSGNQSALLHTVEKAGHVGITRDHAVADALAGHAVGAGAAQNAKDVVLRGSEAVGFDEEFGVLGQPIGKAQEGDEKLGFEARRVRSVLTGFHKAEYSRDNDYCQEERKPRG